MKERPILFSGPMVRAILSGQKTVTRRVVKGVALQWLCYGFKPGYVADPDNALCPYGQPGDRLWVRESTEAHDSPCGAVTLARYSADKAPVLITDCADPAFKGSVAHWNYPRAARPSIHMKREQARILLEITAVRVERLQDISEEQAESEGVKGEPCDHARLACADIGCWGDTAKGAFGFLWESLNGAESWAANPWVWVVEFKRVAP